MLIACTEVAVHGPAPTSGTTPGPSETVPIETDPTTATVPVTTSGTTTSTTTGATCWSEPLDPLAPVDDVESAFRSTDDVEAALEVLLRRFPAGHDLLVEMEGDPYIDIFVEGGSFSAMMDSLMTVVHEETHGWDYEHAIYPERFGYFLTTDVQYAPEWRDGFPRSRILPYVEGNATSLYDGTYLTGTQGTYGFTELLDETNCYVNGLGGALAGWDAIPWTFSAKDGPLAFLYYVELYLEVALEDDPDFYTEIQADPEVTSLVLDLWLRTHFMLAFADQASNLGIEDQEIRELVYAHQATLEDFLGVTLAADACLP